MGEMGGGWRLEAGGKKRGVEVCHGVLRAMALDAGALHSVGGCFLGQYWLTRPCFDEQLIDYWLFVRVQTMQRIHPMISPLHSASSTPTTGTISSSTRWLSALCKQVSYLPPDVF